MARKTPRKVARKVARKVPRRTAQSSLRVARGGEAQLKGPRKRVAADKKAAAGAIPQWTPAETAEAFRRFQAAMVDVGGTFGRELSAKGEAAMIDFATTWLSGLYGADIKNSVKRRHATRWNNEPWVLGAWSAAAPGAQPARKILTEPVSGRIFFAGEATHESLWGTVNGAWESGERAADAVLKLIGRR